MPAPKTIFPDDIFLVSYPKSGNTWMRFHLAVLVHNRKCSWRNIHTVTPDIYLTTEKKLLNIPRPRIIKSHEGYNSRYPKVIYIVRDVRDVVISFFYYQKKEGQFPHDFNAFFHAFLNGEIWPSGWDAHVKGWLANCNRVPNGFLLLRYEDLRRDIKGETRRILQFLQIEKKAKEIDEACQWSSFDHVKDMERREHPSHKIPFLRDGKEGQWISALSFEQKQQMNRKYGDLLVQLGDTV